MSSLFPTNTTNTVTTASATTSGSYNNTNKAISNFIAANANANNANNSGTSAGEHSKTGETTDNPGTPTTTGGTTSFYNHHYTQPSGHSFLSDVNEVKDMENSLLTLLASFHAGDLSAFGKGCSLQTMETIRVKQERLSALHNRMWTTGAQRSTKAGTATTDSTQQNWMSDDDQNKLVAELRELSLEIEKLHETSS